MIDKSVFITILLLVLTGIVKAHVAGIKLLLLAGAGVAGLYMIHLLAQDYNKYQANRPGKALLGGFLSKRSIDDREGQFSEIERSTLGGSYGNDFNKFDMILRYDPTGCARRYVCTISTKSTKKLTQVERSIINMFRDTPNSGRISSGKIAFQSAIELGRNTRDPEACALEFPKCIFSVSQMMRMIGAT